MSDPHRIARAIVIGVIACYAISFVGWTLVVWGALAGWQLVFGGGIAVAVVSVVYGLWKVGYWTWMGLFPRWIAVFCCGGPIGLMIVGFTYDSAKPLPDPTEQAKWEAEFGWLPPLGYAVGGLTLLVGLLLYLPPVTRFLADQRLSLEQETPAPTDSPAS